MELQHLPINVSLINVQALSDVDKLDDARLIIATMISMKNNIPKHIVEKIKELSLVKNQYAAFDLDNTLLIGDIGEAVFAMLVKKNIVKHFGWDDYQNLIETDREKAYFKVIEVMDNLELSVVENITHEIIRTDDIQIELDEYKIPIPKPNTLMQKIVTLLNTSGIAVNVVTASNSVSAEIICWEYFSIPASNVFGARVDITDNKRIKTKFNEVPYGKNKVDVLKREFKDKPVFTAGDANWDRFLLSYTTQNGIRLWTGIDSDYKKLKEKYYKDLVFYQL